MTGAVRSSAATVFEAAWRHDDLTGVGGIFLAMVVRSTGGDRRPPSQLGTGSPLRRRPSRKGAALAAAATAASGSDGVASAGVPRRKTRRLTAAVRFSGLAATRWRMFSASSPPPLPTPSSVPRLGPGGPPDRCCCRRCGKSKHCGRSRDAGGAAEGGTVVVAVGVSSSPRLCGAGGGLGCTAADCGSEEGDGVGVGACGFVIAIAKCTTPVKASSSV